MAGALDGQPCSPLTHLVVTVPCVGDSHLKCRYSAQGFPLPRYSVAKSAGIEHPRGTLVREDGSGGQTPQLPLHPVPQL